MCIDFSYESVMQIVHVNCQALVSLKKKTKKIFQNVVCCDWRLIKLIKLG